MLHRYFWRRFTLNLLLFGAIFFCLTFTLELESHLSSFFGTTYGMLDVTVLTLLKVPNEIYGLLPIIFLLASTATAYRMTVDHELIATRAAGLSGYVSTFTMSCYAIFTGIVLVCAFGPVSAITSQLHQNISDRYNNQFNQLFISSDGQVWLRLESEDRTMVLRADETLDGHTYHNVTVHQFDEENRPIVRYEADSADLEENVLKLVDVKEWNVADHAHAEANSISRDLKILLTNTDRDGILLLLQPPSNISIWTIRRLISELERSGFSSVRYQVHYNSELALPVLLAVMTILGTLVAKDPRRHFRVITSILIILITGLGTFFMMNVVRVMGEHGTLPILVSTWFLPAALFCAAIAISLLVEGR